MANRQANPVIGVAVVAAVVIVALMVGRGSQFDVGFCLLLGLIAIELANVYLAICLTNCGADNPTCQNRCWRRYFYTVNVLVAVTVLFCLFGWDRIF